MDGYRVTMLLTQENRNSVSELSHAYRVTVSVILPSNRITGQKYSIDCIFFPHDNQR